MSTMVHMSIVLCSSVVTFGAMKEAVYNSKIKQQNKNMAVLREGLLVWLAKT